MKILLNDLVQIISGKDRGRQGKVLRSSPKSRSLIVEGLNIFTKHVKPQSGQPGSIVKKERQIDISKVALICPSCKKVTRVGYQIDKSGDKNRICRKCKTVIELTPKKK